MESAEAININGLSPDQWQAAIKEAAAEANAIAANVSPPGSFPQLPRLLDDRRAEFGLVDAIFACQPIFNCVWIYQIELNMEESYVPGGVIVKSDVAKIREKETTSRGVLVGAGLQALDELKSHGVELGHIVRFIKLAPFKIPVGYAGGKQVHVLQMRSGDILGSEDLAQMLRSRVYEVRDVGGEGAPDHRYSRSFDSYTTPVKKLPFISEDS